MQKNEKEVVSLANVFTPLPSYHPRKAGRTNTIHCPTPPCKRLVNQIKNLGKWGEGLPWLNVFDKKEYGMGKKRANLLDVLVKERTIKALDEMVAKSQDYQNTLIWQRAAFERLDMAGLSEEQSDLVDKAVSAINDCGVAYGMAAYRLGLQDGIRLASEVRRFE